MNKPIYKIQNKNTGMFASPDGWSKKGKHWNQLGHVRLHLSNYSDRGSNKYQDAELVTYELVETSRIPMYQVVSEAWEAKHKRDHAAEVAHKKWLIEKAKRDIEEAQRKLKELGA